jgi:hypothetical protein
MKSGFNWRVSAGFLDLAAGLVLLVIGCRRLTSGLARGWRLAAVPLIVVVVLVITWTITPAVMATNVPVIPAARINRKHTV